MTHVTIHRGVFAGKAETTTVIHLEDGGVVACRHLGPREWSHELEIFPQDRPEGRLYHSAFWPNWYQISRFGCAQVRTDLGESDLRFN